MVTKMPKQNQSDKLAEMQKRLIESAFDFLERAISEFVQNDLKYSVVHFCSAVEQFLKARVMQNNGWEAIVETREGEPPPSFADFQAGNFKSISLGRCCCQLKRSISAAEKNAFIGLANHRNKVIHFYHPAMDVEKEEIAKEQSRCWFILKRFLDSLYRYRIEAIDGQYALYHPYLQTIWDQKKVFISALTKAGTAFQKCPACRFESFQCEWSEDSEVEHECLVCGLQAGNEEIGHCRDCDSLNTVVQVGCVFYCMNCHQFYSSIQSCSHCGALNTSLPQDADGGGDVSAWLGCVECDGQRDDS
jgi:hypothetical protein